jgi:quinohemoprotein ethanol dehydrogenase
MHLIGFWHDFPDIVLSANAYGRTSDATTNTNGILDPAATGPGRMLAEGNFIIASKNANKRADFGQLKQEGRMRSRSHVWLSAWVMIGLGATGNLAWGADDMRTPTQRLSDDSDGRDWAAYGATYGEQHYSPLTSISDHDVGNLRLAWYMDLPPGNPATQALEIDGVLYFAVGYSVLHAVDAQTGRLLWKYDPTVAEHAAGNIPNGWGSRGIAWWDGKIYTATLDGRLIAVDAKTGKPLWSTQTLDPGAGYYITGAPFAFDGKIIVGNSGSDFADGCTPPDCPVVRGYVATYDASSGKELWRFYVVPGDPSKGFENKAMERAAKTWAGEWWKKGGGGTVWNAMAYDPGTDTMIIGTGNGAPHSHVERSEGRGDNLYLASIVGLDAKTGDYKWHYQVAPGENWDFTATMDIQFATLRINGRDRKVLVHAPKNGFVYVIDRTNGKLISAEPWVPTTWASRIDVLTGRPVENPGARDPSDKTFLMQPNSWGAHSWMPSALSRQTGLLYIPTIYNNPRAFEKNSTPSGTTGVLKSGDFGSMMPDAQTTELTAWNPATQKAVWRVATVGPTHGGVMATGGNLVFHGEVDGRFSAYDAKTGARLWSFNAQAPVLSPPLTYIAHGKQYITVLSGLGTSSGVLGPLLERFNIRFDQPRRVLTFALEGTAMLPPKHVAPLAFPDDPTFDQKVPGASQGETVFLRRCLTCHGLDAIASGSAPDLRASAVQQSAEAFKAIVHGGALAGHGMPRFEYLSDAALAQLRQYLRSKAADARAGAKQRQSGPVTPPG